MAKKKDEKTNVMRILDQKKIPYTAHFYEESEGPEGTREYGVHVAQALGQDPERAFKTLVAKGASGGYYVFDIPTPASLDLKKAARAVGEKSIRGDGVYPGRVQPRGDEEAVPHDLPPDGAGV